MSNNEPKELSEQREKICEIDSKILRLLAERRNVSSEIIKSKNEFSLPIRDLKREDELINRLVQESDLIGLDSFYVKKIFNEIIEDSVRYQQKIVQKFFMNFDETERVKISIQGIPGSYSSLVAMKFFNLSKEKIIFNGKETFVEVLKAVETGESDYAMLPIENTTSGGINEAYDALMHTNLNIIGEEIYPIHHCLMGLQESQTDTIRKIYAHPQAAVQCNKFIDTLTNCRIEYCTDTALSAKKVLDESIMENAAIASREAAEILGLKILRENIANQEGNYTRFLIISKRTDKVDLRIPCKTSLVMATAQKAGALVEALTVFKEFSINMTKLESRPIPGNPWEEMFYVDFEGNLEDNKIKEAVEKLSSSTKFFKILGCYPAFNINNEPLNTEEPEEIKIQQTDKQDVKIKKTDGTFKLASRSYKSENTIIDINGLKIGDGNFVVIAGPCSVESEKQIIETASVVKSKGAQILRGGCFKPRTSPYAFQGMGLEGLELLYKAGRLYNLPIITEVLSEEFLKEVAEKSDIIQIGARNMQNFALLKEVGKLHKPVLLKRGMMSSIDELLSATEYILAGGNRQVILCERGIRTFETATRNTLDLSAIPVIKELSHLPVFVDPSHAVGERDKVIPMALAAKAAGADGIMVEIHPEPEKALSDGKQSLYFNQFENLMQKITVK